jgi:hypothetical protein
MAAHWPSRRGCLFMINFGSYISAHGYYGYGSAMSVLVPGCYTPIVERAAGCNGRSTLSNSWGCVYRQRRSVAASILGWTLRSKRRIAGYRGTCRRMHGWELALPLSTRRVPICFSNWRAIAGFRGSDILECYCTLEVLTGEHGGVLPLHEHSDVRGHGKERGRGAGCGIIGSSSAEAVWRHGSCQASTAESRTDWSGAERMSQTHKGKLVKAPSCTTSEL